MMFQWITVIFFIKATRQIFKLYADVLVANCCQRYIIFMTELCMMVQRFCVF